MKKALYAVRDSKAAIFFPPFPQINDETAARAFYAAAMDPTTDLSRYPDDYSLWCLGWFDDESGSLEGATPPRVVVSSARMPVTFQQSKEA